MLFLEKWIPSVSEVPPNSRQEKDFVKWLEASRCTADASGTWDPGTVWSFLELKVDLIELLFERPFCCRDDTCMM